MGLDQGAARPAGGASTGPHSIECGDVEIASPAKLAEVLLQRGRTQLSAEMGASNQWLTGFGFGFNGAALN